MNNIQHQPNNMREKVVGLEEKRNKSPNNGDEEEASLLQLQESPHDEYLYQLQAIKQQQQHLPAVAAAAATTSPPSASSSPTHEFSFTISLQPAQPIKINNDKTAKLLATAPPQPSPPPQPFAIDLSPADDIFFHGHLLPLHLLAHLPVSPRSSTNSLDSFTLPIKELLQVQDHADQNDPTPSTSINNDTSFCQAENSGKGRTTTTTTTATTTRVKSKSFSIFGIPKWRKRNEERDQKEEEEEEDRDYCSNSFSYKKKLKLEVTNVLKRYARMVVRPLLPFGGSKRSKMEFQRQPYNSYSGNILSARDKEELRRRRGEFSAPSSMRTSPTNSGILLATLSGTVSPTKSTSDSTMEELQAAIQAAITHCKNSIAMDEDHDKIIH